MPSFAGIIYPNAFQMSELIVSMSQIFISMPSSQPFRFFRYKNCEIGTWNVPIGSNPQKSIWGFFDGEMFNAKEIAAELSSQGFHPKSDDDPIEILVLGYEAWQEEIFEKINGPFATAIFDEEKETILLTLDRMGQKTLYWTFQSDHWLFSTEIKGLLASGIVPQMPSITAFSSYLYLGFIPQDISIIDHVNKLLPGHYIKVDLKRKLVINQYWSLSKKLREREPYQKQEAEEKLGSLLESSIKKMAASKPSIGTSITENLGSIMLTSLLTHYSPRENVDSYAICFEEQESSLLNFAKKISEELQVRNHTKKVTVDQALDELPRIIWHLDEPIADPSILQTWMLGQLTQRTCSILTIDVGWEELLGGRPQYFASHHEEYEFTPPLSYKLAHLPPFFRDKFLLPLLSRINLRYAFKILRSIDINKNQIAYLMHKALFKGNNRKKVSPFLYRYFDPEVFTQRFHRLTQIPGSVHPSLYFDLKTALPNHALSQYNRLLLPFGTKIFAPFLDNDLINFSTSLPDEVKFAHNEPGALLKELWKRLHQGPLDFPLQPALIAPSWTNHPRLRKLFTNLTKGRLVEEGFISAKWIREQTEPSQLTDIAFRELWSILVLETWFILFINRPVGMQNHEVNIETLLRI
ncbi:MAG: asparagine synthetase B family protein [Chlamydiales bacterium]